MANEKKYEQQNYFKMLVLTVILNNGELRTDTEKLVHITLRYFVMSV